MRYEVGKNLSLVEAGKLWILVNGVREVAAFAFNISAGYYERYVRDPKNPKKLKIDGPIMAGKTRHLVTERVYKPFVVVYRDSGKPFCPQVKR
jgi:hypothetical protein